MKYKKLSKSALVRQGDERWDPALKTWLRCNDDNMQRFSTAYRRVGTRRKWRRPVA